MPKQNAPFSESGTLNEDEVKYLGDLHPDEKFTPEECVYIKALSARFLNTRLFSGNTDKLGNLQQLQDSRVLDKMRLSGEPRAREKAEVIAKFALYTDLKRDSKRIGVEIDNLFILSAADSPLSSSGYNLQAKSLFPFEANPEEYGFEPLPNDPGVARKRTKSGEIIPADEDFRDRVLHRAAANIAKRELDTAIKQYEEDNEFIIDEEDIIFPEFDDDYIHNPSPKNMEKFDKEFKEYSKRLDDLLHEPNFTGGKSIDKMAAKANEDTKENRPDKLIDDELLAEHNRAEAVRAAEAAEKERWNNLSFFEKIWESIKEFFGFGKSKAIEAPDKKEPVREDISEEFLSDISSGGKIRNAPDEPQKSKSLEKERDSLSM